MSLTSTRLKAGTGNSCGDDMIVSDRNDTGRTYSGALQFRIALEFDRDLDKQADWVRTRPDGKTMEYRKSGRPRSDGSEADS